MKQKQLNNYKNVFKNIFGKKENIDKLKEIVLFKSCLKEAENKISTREGYTDGANILIIIPKTEEMKDLIENNVNENYKKSLDKLNFDYLSEKKEMSSYFSGEYLFKLLTLFKYSETIKVKIQKDYPIWIEDG